MHFSSTDRKAVLIESTMAVGIPIKDKQGIWGWGWGWGWGTVATTAHVDDVNTKIYASP